MFDLDYPVSSGNHEQADTAMLARYGHGNERLRPSGMKVSVFPL